MKKKKKKNSLGLRSRFDYFLYRARALNLPSVATRARQVAAKHHKWAPVVFVDMLWSSAFRDTGFQDYVDWDFAVLSRSERATFMTNAISNHLAERYNAQKDRVLFENKLEFNKVFDQYLHRAWLDVRTASADDIRTLVELRGKAIAKEPVSNSGYGVRRYDASGISDWDAFRAELLEKGQQLIEEYIVQHPALSAVSPGVVNTTRVTTFLDGDDVHVLSFAQKFGVGNGASDQQSFGGFFTLLDENGASLGPGYGSHGHIYAEHPETGASITQFRLPMADQVLALVREASTVVPDIRYVGWDVVVCEDGPVLLEGNWMPGAYENKPTATGVRHGSLPRFKEVFGF